MAKAGSQNARYSPEECRHIARQASAIHAVVGDPQVITQRARVVSGPGE